MLDRKDAQWWILEAEKHPESAPDLIRTLAERLVFLDKQNEELRSELVTLRRKQRGGAGDVDALQQRIQELESALRAGRVEQRLLVYAQDRIEYSGSLGVAQTEGIGRELPDDLTLLVCDSLAKLLIITTESQTFSLSFADLPVPEGQPAMLGNPRNVAAILDQAVFERCRFLTLLSRSGYVYSLLAGTVNQVSKRQDRLIRNLIPDDPIVAAIPSHNGDLVAISQKGRWTRFPEKSIAGSGSLAMELPKGDTLAGVVSLSRETTLTIITTDGKLFVRPTQELKARRGPGASAGMLLKGETIFGVSASDDITFLTRCGNVLSVMPPDLPYKAQTDAGAPLPGLTADDSLLAYL
jgi:DNA gyrase/topoisomerase IV subunit A